MFQKKVIKEAEVLVCMTHKAWCINYNEYKSRLLEPIINLFLQNIKENLNVGMILAG
tara:strand:- start:155 stop:325 length:171 start_codon:yes stop_codon:yes gene_type:complete